MPSSITTTFLTALFGDSGDLSELDRILIWTAPSKTSFYFSTPAEAADQVQAIGQSQNVYFGCGIAPRGLANYERAKAREVRGIPGIWADIDIYNPRAHQKENIAPDIDAAIALAESLPILPTLIVCSGYGIQPWWLFKEPWMFQTDFGLDVERARAADIVAGWQGMVKEAAAARGWEHDATHDLSRVMRLPGTFNIKDPHDIRKVTVIKWHDIRRYNPQDFEGYLLYHSSEDLIEAEQHVHEPEFTPRRTGGIPPGFVVLLAEDKRLLNTWERKRKDLKDTSFSGFDMSIAGIMASYGDIFSDQDIADVLAAGRDKHCEHNSKEWLKGHDRQYISRTIKKARIQRYSEVKTDALIDELDKGAHVAQLAIASEDIVEITGEDIDNEIFKAEIRTEKASLSHTEKAKKLQALSAILRVKLSAIRRYDADPPIYEVIVGNIPIKTGGIASIVNFYEFRKAIAAYSGIMIPSFKPDRWNKICQALLDSIDDVEVGDEGTESGMIANWLRSYLAENRATTDVVGACKTRQPFKEDWEGRETYFIFLESLQQWLIARQERLKPNELAVMIRRYGCEPRKVKVNLAGEGEEAKWTTRSIYKLPG